MYDYKAKVVNIVDGDTWDLLIDVGFYLTRKTRVRLARINAPERGSKRGKDATLYCKKTYLNKDVYVSTDKTGKRGRRIAEISYDGLNVGDELLRLSLADQYI